MTSTEAQLCVTEIALQNATTEIEKLQRDLDQAQEANMTAIGRTQAAEGKVVELEFGLHEVEREHALFKGRAESRLEILRLSFEQEEREGAAQVKTETQRMTRSCRSPTQIYPRCSKVTTLTFISSK